MQHLIETKPDECPACHSVEWDRITDRTAPGASFNRCSRCESEWTPADMEDVRANLKEAIARGRDPYLSADQCVALVRLTDSASPPCTVCGKQASEHGTYPTCATHPYSSDGKCTHVGTFASGTFTGAPCLGAECKNGCARAR